MMDKLLNKHDASLIVLTGPFLSHEAKFVKADQIHLPGQEGTPMTYNQLRMHNFKKLVEKMQGSSLAR